MRAPAPWQLRGRAWLCALELPERVRVDQGGAPEVLGRPGGRLSYLMFVDYQMSPVGPYRELLLIPGHYRFADGRRHPSIGRIYVSSQDSVINGQLNWGIPKDRADFHLSRGEHEDRVELSGDDGRVFARLAFRHRGPGLPLPGGLIPAKQRTLGQYRDGQTFLYSPAASGSVHYARLEQGWADGIHFPEIQQGRMRACAYLSHFDMKFPQARVLDASGQSITPAP